MPLKNNTLYFVVTLTSTLLCCAAGAVFVARPELHGNLHLRSLVSDRQHATAAPTRHGSLSFKFDQQGDHRSSPVFHNLMTAKLKRIAPSVHCGDNLMTLMLKGIRAPHILVDSGEGPRIPLSQMPSECGFSVKRSRRDVHFAAPYEGCHVTQQGGNYVLPLRLWGAPMTMSCPAALPPPSVSCFPSGMVVKMSGITANDLKVKVSGMWRSLSSVCGSCGIAVEMLSGGLTLIAPYNRGLCIKMKDEEYLLSLLLADAELLVTCPSLPDIKPTTAATTPPSDSGQVLQYPQYHQFPVFSQYPVFPGPAPPPHTAAPNKGAAAPSSQHPQLLSGAARDLDTENQEASAAQHPAFPFLPHFSQYPLFPRPVPPTQSPATKNTAAPPAKQPQVPQSPHYPFPFFPHLPMVPGNFHPTTPAPPPPPPPPPATNTEALETTPAPTTKHDGKPNVPQQPQFLMPPHYPFLSFPKVLQSPPGQTPQDPKPVIQQPKPYHVYPQTYQIPVLYPPPKYPTQTATPVTTTTTTTAATTLKPAAQKPFYYPHPYMPAYYVPQKAPNPVFLDPVTHPANPAPTDQQERQLMYRAMPPFYPFPSHQRPKSASRNR